MSTPIKCPNCGSIKIAKIEYGLVPPDDYIVKGIQEGEIILGGNYSDIIEPAFACSNCQRGVWTYIGLSYEIREMINNCAIQFDFEKYWNKNERNLEELANRFLKVSKFEEKLIDNFALFSWFQKK